MCLRDPCTAEEIQRAVRAIEERDRRESEESAQQFEEVNARLDTDLAETTALVAELAENEGAFCMLMGDEDNVGRVRHGKTYFLVPPGAS